MNNENVIFEHTVPSKLNPLIEAGYELIPLRPKDKKPRDQGWTTKPYKNEDVVAYMMRNGNVGVRLSASDLVVDVDPRNFGDDRENHDPFSEFVLSYGIDLSNSPRVQTGGGGSHYYFKKPSDVTIVDKLSDFPGVEFKTLGRQVVAPGSIHPQTEKLYVCDPIDDDFTNVPFAPDALLNAIERKLTDSPQIGAGECTPAQVAQMLDALDPTKYREFGLWFKIMCACHHGSGGKALSEFIKWSASDPLYADAAEEIRPKWHSLNVDKSGPIITVRTLYRELSNIGRTRLIPQSSPERDSNNKSDTTTSNTNVLENDEPMLVATEMLNGHTYLQYNNDWYRYEPTLNRYKDISDSRFRSMVWNWINGRPYQFLEKGEVKTGRIVANKNRVANIEEAAKALRQGPEKVPDWIEQHEGDPKADELFVCANGLLHLQSRKLLEPTERFFSINGSPVAFDKNAAVPGRWLRFLNDLFPEQPDCIATLQEVTGYFLTQDTSLQKIVQLVGPPRAGKGIYTRVLQSLVGQGNHTTPSTKRLSGEFGMQPLIGKQLAVISDMRIDGYGSNSGLTETLLTVSGEDSVSIPRKYKENWEGKLNTRFLLVSNEALQLRDTSNALGARIILIVMRKSFLGKEDEALFTKLEKELPGILNWALDGLDRLMARGHLVQPKSCRPDLEQMSKLMSPVKGFIDDALVTGHGRSIEKELIWRAYCYWCDVEGINYSGSKAHFIKDLRSAGVQFTPSRPRRDGERVHMLNGVDLTEEFHEEIRNSEALILDGFKI